MIIDYFLECGSVSECYFSMKNLVQVLSLAESVYQNIHICWPLKKIIWTSNQFRLVLSHLHLSF